MKRKIDRRVVATVIVLAVASVVCSQTVPDRTIVIDVIGRDNRGLAISLYLSLFDVGMGSGSVFYGWISDLYGYRTMYLVAGLLFLLAGLLFTWKAPDPKS